MDKWRIIPFERCDSFENMAIDEAIFRVNRQGEMPPTLRFYGWKKPAVSLGYFQNAEEEINCEYCRDRDIDIVRRPTGGKAVLHGDDLTYSLVAREDNQLFSSDVVETYRIISGCIIRGLEESGVEAKMVEEGRVGDGSSEAFCFAATYKNELLADGRKICGSAQVRARGVFLQHGSLLMDFDPLAVCAAIITKNAAIEIENAAIEIEKLKASVSSVRKSIRDNIGIDILCRNIAAGFEEILNVRLTEGKLSPEEETLRDSLLESKYSSDRWNMKGRGIKSEH
ncbi:MAG: lipoate--protein ligase family protein [Deltaproteobacteria bacterium]|nr:lipoate--protein ligase family protein [Deltaproteobacteria bacterium]